LELKETLNLPRTDFPMKARLPELEPRLLERWEKENLYQKLRAARKNAPVFVLHDGPPYGKTRRSSSCTTARPTPTARSTWARP